MYGELLKTVGSLDDEMTQLKGIPFLIIQDFMGSGQIIATLFVVNITTCTYTYTRTLLAQGKRFCACCLYLAG